MTTQDPPTDPPTVRQQRDRDDSIKTLHVYVKGIDSVTPDESLLLTILDGDLFSEKLKEQLALTGNLPKIVFGGYSKTKSASARFNKSRLTLSHTISDLDANLQDVGYDPIYVCVKFVPAKSGNKWDILGKNPFAGRDLDHKSVDLARQLYSHLTQLKPSLEVAVGDNLPYPFFKAWSLHLVIDTPTSIADFSQELLLLEPNLASEEVDQLCATDPIWIKLGKLYSRLFKKSAGQDADTLDADTQDVDHSEVTINLDVIFPKSAILEAVKTHIHLSFFALQNTNVEMANFLGNIQIRLLETLISYIYLFERGIDPTPVAQKISPPSIRKSLSLQSLGQLRNPLSTPSRTLPPDQHDAAAEDFIPIWLQDKLWIQSRKIFLILNHIGLAEHFDLTGFHTGLMSCFLPNFSTNLRRPPTIAEISMLNSPRKSQPRP